LDYPNAVPPLYGRRSGFIARQRDFRAAVVASCSTFWRVTREARLCASLAGAIKDLAGISGGTSRGGGPFFPPGDGQNIPGFPGSYRVRSKTRMLGGRLRPRWKTPAGRILEWDYQHGTVEVYDARGEHLGECDPTTGAWCGGRVAARKVIP
jgi:hypothetical protein